MTAEKQRSWLPVIIVSAALVLVLFVALSPLIWLFAVRPRFEADDARARIVFSVDVTQTDDDHGAVMESVRRAIEQRLRAAEIVPGFLVQVSGEDRIEVLTPEITPEQLDEIRDLATRPGTLEFSLLANQVDHATLIADATSEGSTIDNDTGAWIPVAEGSDVNAGRFDAYRDTDRGVREFLVVRDRPEMRITGEYLESAMVGYSQNGDPALDFRFDQRGAFLLQRLTAANAPRPGAGFKSRLAIILDGRIHSAPSINAMIGGGRGQIQGDFSEDEIRQLAAALSAGRLPAPVEFVESTEIVGMVGE